MTTEQMQKPAATLEQFAERLKTLQEGAHDVSKLPIVYHRALDLTLHVGGMSGPDFQSYLNRQWFEAENHRVSRREEKGSPKDTSGTDKFLLKTAVWTGDGKRLDDALIEQMLAAPGCGPSNHQVIEAAKKENPPRQQLTAEFSIMWAACQTTFAVAELLFEIGEGGALVDFLSPSATPEQKEQANYQLEKAREAVLVLGPFMDIQRARESLGISPKAAALKIAEAAIAEQETAEKEKAV